MHQRPVRLGDTREFGDRLHGPYLVIGVHDRYNSRVSSDHLAQAVGTNDAALVDGQERHVPSAASQRLQRIEHGFVLNRGGNQMTSTGRLQGFGCAAKSEVVAFGASGGKHNLRGVGPDQGGDLTPGVIDARLGLLAEVVNARRVAPQLPNRPVDPVGDLGGDRGGRVVIEIDTAHRVSIVAFLLTPSNLRGRQRSAGLRILAVALESKPTSPGFLVNPQTDFIQQRGRIFSNVEA